MPKKLKKWLEDAVKKTAKGNVKITIPGMLVQEYKDVVFNEMMKLTHYCQGISLNVKTYPHYAKHLFLVHHYNKYFQHRDLPPEDYTVQVTLSEAYNLFGTLTDNSDFTSPLFHTLTMELHKKII